MLWTVQREKAADRGCDPGNEGGRSFKIQRPALQMLSHREGRLYEYPGPECGTENTGGASRQHLFLSALRERRNAVAHRAQPGAGSADATLFL